MSAATSLMASIVSLALSSDIVAVTSAATATTTASRANKRTPSSAPVIEGFGMMSPLVLSALSFWRRHEWESAERKGIRERATGNEGFVASRKNLKRVAGSNRERQRIEQRQRIRQIPICDGACKS